MKYNDVIRFVKINKQYKELISEIDEGTFYDFSKGSNQNVSKITPYTLFDGTNISTPIYLGYDNSLVTDNETVILRLVSDCLDITDNICNKFNIDNKLYNHKTFIKNLIPKNSIKVIDILIKNLDYLKKKIPNN